MVEQFETLTPWYLINVNPKKNTPTYEILTKIIIDDVGKNSNDYWKILNFTSKIKELYNTVNNNIRLTYGQFKPNWTTHAQFTNLDYSGKKGMLEYIQFVNNLSLTFSKVVHILEKYNEYNMKREELRQQKLRSFCYGNFHYPYNSPLQIKHFVNKYDPYPSGILL